MINRDTNQQINWKSSKNELQRCFCCCILLKPVKTPSVSGQTERVWEDFMLYNTWLRLIHETCSAFRNALMFNNELMADIHFIVGPTGGSQKVPAHKVKRFHHGILTSLSVSVGLEKLCLQLLKRTTCALLSNLATTVWFCLHVFWRICLLPPSLPVCAGRGKLRLLCHVLRRSGGGGVWDPYPRCGTCCFSNSAEVSHSPSLTHSQPEGEMTSAVSVTSKHIITHPKLSGGECQKAASAREQWQQHSTL